MARKTGLKVGLMACIGWGLLACAHSNPERRGTTRHPAPAAVDSRNAPLSQGADPQSADSQAVEAANAGAQIDNKALIRLHNLSDSLPLTQVLVRFPADSMRIGFIGPRAYSDYFAVDRAYRYAFIQAKSGGMDYFCQPADFTGETPLAPGRYTYELSQVRNRDPDAKMGFFLLELLEDKGHP